MKITTAGLDLAKEVFQVHGVNAHGKTELRKQLRRGEMAKFFANLEPCLIGMEACGSAVSIPPSRRLDADCLPLV
ncbi:MAG: transposase, partial [Gallionellaceae bacterium]